MSDEVEITAKDIDFLPEVTNDTEDPAGVRERIRVARKAEAQADERMRLAAQLALSPRCERNTPVTCRDLLAYHDPCSKCPCPGFVGTRPVLEYDKPRAEDAAVGIQDGDALE